MPRILFVHHASQLGGAENSLLELVKNLEPPYEAVVACPHPKEKGKREKEKGHSSPSQHLERGQGARSDPGSEQEMSSSLIGQLRLLGVAVEPVPLIRFKRTSNPILLARYLMAWRRGARELSRIVRRAGIDLIHSNSTTAHVYGSAAAKQTGVPSVWHVRDVAIPSIGSIVAMPRLCRNSACIAISQFIAGRLKAAAGIDAEVIHNGVDLQRFHPADAPPSDPVVLMVAQVVPWKGQRDFLQAAAMVKRRIPAVRFRLIGSDLFDDHPEYRGLLGTLAQRLDLADTVEFAGYRDDVPGLLRKSTLLVMPSRDEPFGRAVIEAMASGLPVVAYNEGGPAEIVVDGQTGLLAPPGDVPALADAIVRVLSNPDEAARFGRAGRQRAVELFDARQTARKIMAVYSRLLEGTVNEKGKRKKEKGEGTA